MRIVRQPRGDSRQFSGLAEPSELAQSPTADPFEAVSDDAQRESWRPPRRLLLVPCSRPADVLAVLGWDYSQLPAPLIAAVLRSWEQRFAAVPVELEPSALTLHIGAPPTRIEQARKLAAEIAGIVEGPLLAGAALEGLAQTLLTGRGELATDLPSPDLDVSPTLWRFAFREEATDALLDLTA